MEHEWDGGVCRRCGITEDNYLVLEIIETRNDDKARELARRITDRALLRDIVLKAKNYAVQIVMLGLIADDITLADIAGQTSLSYDLRVKAVRQMKDEVWAKEVFANVHMSPVEQAMYDRDIKAGL
jgi:hypothetical protein